MEYLFNAIKRLADADMQLTEVVSGSQLLTRKMSSDLVGDLSDLMPGSSMVWGTGNEGVIEAFALQRSVRKAMAMYRRILGRALAIWASSRPSTAQEFTDAILLAIDQVFGQSAEALRLKADLATLKIDMPDADRTTSIQAKGRRVLQKRFGELEDAMVPLMPGNRVNSQFDVRGYLSNTFNDDVRLDEIGTNGQFIVRNIGGAKAVPLFTRTGQFEHKVAFDAASGGLITLMKANKAILVSGTLVLTREAVIDTADTVRTAARTKALDEAFLAGLVFSVTSGNVETGENVVYDGAVPDRVYKTFSAVLNAGASLQLTSLAYTAVVHPLSAVAAHLIFDSILPLEKGVTPFATIGADAELRSIIGSIPSQFLDKMQSAHATRVLNEIEAYDDWARRVNDPHINGRVMSALLNQYCLKHYKTEVGPTNNLYTFEGKQVHKFDFWASQIGSVFTQAQWSDIYSQWVSVLPIYHYLAISSPRYCDRWSETEIAEI